MNPASAKALAKSSIPTPGHKTTGLTKEELVGFMEYVASATPLAQTGTDEEVAEVVTFLASDDSSFVAGSEIFVGGGIARI